MSKKLPVQSTIIALLVIIAMAPVSVWGQSAISGTVHDKQTNQPLPFVAVYLNFTTSGIYTNNEGKFVLKNVPFGKHELVASYPGYQSFQLQFENKDTTTLRLDIKLTVLPLQEVSITSRQDDKWKSQLQRFHNLFFGNVPLAKQCRILNPWVLDFEVTPQLFKATAAAAIIIENPGLGYRINYQLKKFEVRATDYTVSGIGWFQELPSADTALMALWKRRRATVYLGSTRQLLLAIANGTLQADGYQLYEDISKSKDVVRQPTFSANLSRNLRPFSIEGRVLDGHRAGDQFFLRLPPKLEVHYIKGKSIPKLYRDIASPISWLEVTNGNVEINRFGIVMNPASLTVSGAMGELRMAELLPYNYLPQIDQLAPAANQGPDRNLLLERVYAHTDKTIYYTDEPLHFKAYMKYSSPAYQDTLSNVLIVDLIGEDKVLRRRKLFGIDTLGTSSGGIHLAGLRPGRYQLQAYTRWMLNFDSTLIFNKAIQVLSNMQRVAQRSVDTVARTSERFEFKTNGDSFAPGDSLTISMNPMDDRGFAMNGNVSISISPVLYASSGASDANISQLWSIPADEPKQPYQQHLIQYGIEISGHLGVKMKAKKLKSAMAILSQEKTSDLIARNVEADGTFNFPPMQLYDTMKFGLQVIDKAGRKITKVLLDSSGIQVVHLPFQSVQANLDTPSLSGRRTIAPVTLYGSSTLLNEVTIVGAKPSVGKTSDVHLSSDLTLSGDDLRKADNGDILSMIQARVPGLRILAFSDGGIVKKYFKLGGLFTFDRNPTNLEPIVLIDGNVLQTKGGETAAEQVARLSASQIDRVEIVKFGGGAAYGARGANGVIAIYTNRTAPDKSGREFIDRAKFDRISIRGLSKDIPFIAQRDCDAGSTIYWNPSVTIRPGTRNAISAIIPNVTGFYQIVVEGVSSDGEPLRATRLINIEEK
jgi:hypothetical protein